MPVLVLGIVAIVIAIRDYLLLSQRAQAPQAPAPVPAPASDFVTPIVTPIPRPQPVPPADDEDLPDEWDLVGRVAPPRGDA